MEWPVAFHGFDPIGDHVMHGDGCRQFSDGVVDALPMEDVLRPALDVAWNASEQILEAERYAGPVVRFDLRHRNHDVGREHGFG